MFWKLMRWGGTATVVLLVLAAVLLSQGSENKAAPLPPGDAEAPGKNFNL